MPAKRRTIRSLCALLASADCFVPRHVVSHWSADEKALAREWATAILVHDRPLSPRPPFLAAWDARRCRVCGCTKRRPCLDPALTPCSRVDEDLCSACMGPEGAMK